jgi:thiol-disulfide isomerase/thioredoxin
LVYKFGVQEPEGLPMTIRMAFAALIALFAVGATPCPGAPPPRVGVESLSQVYVPEYPFNEYADADSDVANAFVKARAQNKRVLIDLGANWCADCRILAGIMELPEVKRFLDAHFVVVVVDVGRFNRNLQIPARFGITQRLEGVPSVLIASSDGRLINANHTEALVDARSMSPQDIVNWLAYWG